MFIFFPMGKRIFFFIVVTSWLKRAIKQKKIQYKYENIENYILQKVSACNNRFPKLIQ